MADPTLRDVGTDSVAESGEVFGTLNAHLLKGKLSEAELLLSYAVETGVQLDPAVSRSVLEAGTASRTGWSEHTATNLLTAEATLAAILKPVSAESLQNSARYRSKSLRRRLALPVTMGILAAVIVLYSTAAFLFSAFSTNIRDNIAVANPLAVKLVDELGSAQVTSDLCSTSATSTSSSQAGPAQGAASSDSSDQAGVHRKYEIADLQSFAGAIRDMYGAAQQLNRLYPFSAKQLDPYKMLPPNELTHALELPPGLPNLAVAAAERICVYQRVRYFAQSTEENATVFIGAVATGILPVLYALLGAGAYVLRRLESQLRARTFINETHSPRFITAAIAGAVVGLFNFGQGVSVSPLAIAFLVGYAVDVFFTFLESLIQTLSKARSSTGSDQATAPRNVGGPHGPGGGPNE
jgi:hypothetical protein